MFLKIFFMTWSWNLYFKSFVIEFYNQAGFLLIAGNRLFFRLWSPKLPAVGFEKKEKKKKKGISGT